jgi:aspartate aminotransferase
MFEKLKDQPEDKIMALMALFAEDQRKEKIDLGVGVYKNDNGLTPIMAAVSEAIAILNAEQKSKSYVGLLGNIKFIDQMIQLVLKDSVPRERVVGGQAPGGTGALHQTLLLIRSLDSNPRVWISSPSWPNHSAILKHLGMNQLTYSYFDQNTCEVGFSKMMTDLEKAKSGDILLLHGCCHNPTGANLSQEHWIELTKFCLEKNIIPLVDLAYQGFGDGIEEDVVNLQYMASNLPEMCLAVSCSKNFGLYRERVGTSLIIVSNKKEHKLAEDNLKSFNRLTFSFPPDFGAAVVNLVLSECDSNRIPLVEKWKLELTDMRSRMLDLRSLLSDSLMRNTNSNRFDFVANHRGMFSLLGLSPDEVMRLRTEHGIYMVGDSRINIAGLNHDQIEKFSVAVASVI